MEMLENLGLALFFLAMGAIGLCVGIRYLQGYHKSHFLSSSVRLGSNAWMALPSGILFLMWGVGTVLVLAFDEQNDFIVTVAKILWIGGLGVALLGFIFALLQVPVMKPAWLKWLEREHGEIMPLLRREAREMGLDIWQRRVDTQEGLEEWVAEVRRKHGL